MRWAKNDGDRRPWVACAAVDDYRFRRPRRGERAQLDGGRELTLLGEGMEGGKLESFGIRHC